MEDRRPTLQKVLGRAKHEGKNGWVVAQSVILDERNY
jgi:hypothetical protein